MLRVLFVNHGAIIGGAETNLLSILRGSEKHKDFQPVGILLPDHGPLEVEACKLGVDVGLISYHAFRWRNPLRYAQTMFQLVGWIRRTRPSVIHLNHQWLVSHVVQAGMVTRTPVVCHVRNYLDAGFVSSQRRWLRRANAIVVESQAVQKRVFELGLPPERVHLIYNGIDMTRFCNSVSGATSKSCGAQIGFSGRIVPEKGPEDLIKAMPIVIRRVPAARLYFLGWDQENGAYVEQLKSLAIELGVERHVVFLGFRNDVENVLQNFDVLAIPSRRTMPEGLPLTMLEGLAAGCLVVATPNSGVPEVIHQGETGFLVPFEEPQALAEAISVALTLPDSEKDRIRRAGQALIASQFTIEQQVLRLGQLYRQLLA